MTTTTPEISTAGLETDPHPIWAWLRESSPVHYASGLGLWLVARWDDVHRVTTDADTFSAELPSSPLSRTVGANMLHADGGRHEELRAVAAPIMRPRVIERQAEVARSLAAARLAGFTDDECVDLMASFAEPVVAEFLRRVIGLDDVSDSALGEWFRGIGAGASNFEGATDKQAHADAVTAEIDEAVARALAPGRPVADGSLLDVLGPHGADVPFEFLTSTVKLFIIGGLQEPRDLIGLTLAGVLGTPEQFNLLSADPARLPAAIEEGARWGSPVGTVTRRVAEPVRLEDVTLPQGAIVAGVIAAANRDPRRWNDPDVFDLIRARRPHLAYGAGTHLCLGASAARILVRTALKELLSRWPRLRLVDEPEIRGYEFRGPVALNVQLH